MFCNLGNKSIASGRPRRTARLSWSHRERQAQG
jgi:hypothetical protein